VILGIFLVLVLLCGAFFGMGYKMGSRQTVPLIAVEAGGGRAAVDGLVWRVQAVGGIACFEAAPAV
jgi:hypothetical protein